jgi:heterodisulfide reductase subunit A
MSENIRGKNPDDATHGHRFEADELKRKLRDVILGSKLFTDAELDVILSPGQWPGLEQGLNLREDRRIGVYFLRVAGDASATTDFRAIHEYAAHLPGVHLVRTMTVSAALEPEELARELREENLNTVVLASEHPGFFQPAFSRALTLAGFDGSQVRLASFGERGDGGSAERANGVVSSAVQGVPFTVPQTSGMASFNTATMVIGGGVAGIQAALEIAESGNKVYLVERTGTIGGRMAMFDKTFPTLDCAACILTPKMVAVGQSKNIEILVLSEVEKVTGSVGDFTVKVLKHATRVDASACVACGDCARFCPVTTASEFDMGIATRKGIFIPFPQAVPNAYMIDPTYCNWVLSGGTKCGACAKKCSKGAVHLDAKDEVVELKVGNIIVATGYDTLDPRRIERYGYGTYPNILTSLEFERLTNASGPTGGKIVMKTQRQNKKTKTDEWVFEPEGVKPKAVAIIHCVGSRDKNYNPYCSRVCCMYSLKFAHLVREKVPDAKCYEFYIDMRAFGKGYEEFYERIREEGVFLVRGRSASIQERDSQLYVHGEDVATNHLINLPVDMVVLSVGLQPSEGSAELAEKLDIPRDTDGWFRELNYNAEPNSTGRDGIFLAGVCQGPKDIPDTVAQASAAAAYVLRSIVGASGQENLTKVPLQTVEEKAGSPVRS